MNLTLGTMVLTIAVIAGVVVLAVGWMEFRRRMEKFNAQAEQAEQDFEQQAASAVGLDPAALRGAICPGATLPKPSPRAEPTTLREFAHNLVTLGVLAYMEAEIPLPTGEVALLYRRRDSDKTALLVGQTPAADALEPLLRRYGMVICWQADRDPVVFERFQDRLPDML